jgi:type III restriction enzyme
VSAPMSKTTILVSMFRIASDSRIYRPDFIVLIEDGHGENDLLHLVVEVKGYRREDAKDKKLTMETLWIPGINSSGKFGRWAFAEFTEVYGMEADFRAIVEAEFASMIESQVGENQIRALAVQNYIEKQLGSDPRWLILSRGITDVIGSGKNRRFPLSMLDTVAETSRLEPDKVIAALSSLSAEPNGILRLEFRKGSDEAETVPSSEVAGMLKSWWRSKDLSDAQWKEWASAIQVFWVLRERRVPTA